MRPLLLLILPLAVHAQSLNNINVERFTVLDAENVSWEQGELGASFSLTSSNHSVGLWVFGATLPEVQAVDKTYLATVEYLHGLTTQYGSEALSKFTVSTTTFVLGDHEYKTVAWNAPRTLTASVTAKLVNLSVRAVVPSNGSVTFGFVIGIDNCTVLVRASGPALGGFGVPNTLANPRLAVYKGNSVINSNDDWCIPATNSGDVLSAGNKAGAFPLLLNSKDAAILLTLQPGAYTVQVMGEPNTTGEVLIEVYDINS